MILRTVFLTAWLALSFGAAAQTVKIGETAVLTTGDSDNANLLLAQEASLSQAATIQSMSFYVASAGLQCEWGIGRPWDFSGSNCCLYTVSWLECSIHDNDPHFGAR